MSDVLRTPDERFANLPGFDLEPRYVEVGGGLRMHYVDTGPRDAPVVLMVHGQPTWSYLWRGVIDVLMQHGLRAVAPDLIGFGRSDKLSAHTAYSMSAHISWLRDFVLGLELHDVTLVAQDWGGPLGFAVLTEHRERFARVVAANTILHTVDPALAGHLSWTVHGTVPGRVEIEEALLDYVLVCQRLPEIKASWFVGGACAKPVPADVLAAYDAPFPDDRYMAGVRQFPSLIPLTRNDPGAAINRDSWAALAAWHGPFLTAYSDGDPATAGWDGVLRRLVPGAAGQPHTTVSGAGHFLQEDRPTVLGQIVADFVTGGAPSSPDDHGAFTGGAQHGCAP